MSLSPLQIAAEVRKFVDPGISPGTAFDAILTLRSNRVSFADIVAALATNVSNPTADLSKVQIEYTDDTRMPFGKHAGKALKDIPDDYFRWLWDKRPLSDKLLERYIQRAVMGHKIKPAVTTLDNDDDPEDDPDDNYRGNSELD